MVRTARQNTIRVGLLVAGALAVLMVFLFFIGSEQKIFARKNEYRVRLDTVSGLAEGNPVKLAGVTIGVVKDITLPRDPKQKDVDITLLIDRKYGERIRTDSRARLKKLGLLAGDSYIDITPGSPRFDALEPGSIIPAQRQTNVDQLISSGEDLVDNLVQISYSLKNILSRVDRGEGLLGELTSTPETKQRLTETLMTTLNKINAALSHIEGGRGLVGKMIYDDKYGEQLAASLQATVTSLQTVSNSVQHGLESGNGMIPAMLNDPEGKKKVYALVDNLNTTSQNLSAFSTGLKSGEGLIPRLLNDKAYGDQAMGEFTSLVAQLNQAVQKLNSGEGTAGKLINDPSVYESINDILIGINESKMLRWLVRNRQQSGIKRRVNTLQSAPNVTPIPPDAPPVVPPPPATTTDAAPPVIVAPVVVVPVPATDTTATTTTAPPG
ncbi:MAG: phospholipid/cholesterol/gamma-HCH transport system substrate-binding protein [Acidobacteriota bacterium]|jgi:phospholipid/cholesterol/gamma-HCH transport system substrate-binding protein|nr:phospholipid/cholesterol/gamma-HCH transport system substrate-binding protein [Acidobacteriota bacterium]